MSTKCLAPKSMGELLTLLSEMTSDSKVIGGGTDLIIKINEGACAADALLYMGGIKELTHIVEKDSIVVEIGAGATLAQIAEYFQHSGKLAALSHAAGGVGSAQIRNNATIGGNIGNASPAGDMLPVLFMLDAELTIASPEGFYTKPIQQVLKGQSKTSLEYNEAIVKITINIPEGDGYKSAFVKLGSRKAVTISRIGLAAGLSRDSGGVITSAKMLAGAVAPTPIHIEQAEQYLIGKTVNDDTINNVAQIMSGVIKDILKGRKSMAYKSSAVLGVVTDVFEKLR